MSSPDPSFSSAGYWNERYGKGGNSGAGSYGRLAEFKAATLNEFVARHAVQSVVEFGSGDGAQLERAVYPAYTGIDIAETILASCRQKFAGDPHKSFLLQGSPAASAVQAELALSIDVIFHLIEDKIYHDYMQRLSDAGQRFLGIYSSNFNGAGPMVHAHIRHHRFTDWLAQHTPQWRLIETIKNPYPWSAESPRDLTNSWSDFYFFSRG